MLDFRQAKVEHLHLSAVADEKVGGLDVAMHNSFGVRRLQRIGDLNRHGQQFFHAKRLARHQLPKRLPFQQLHDDEVLAAVLFDRVDGADVGMIQRRSGARLALKAFDQLIVLRHRFRQEFYGHTAAQPRVLGFIHHAHAAAA